LRGFAWILEKPFGQREGCEVCAGANLPVGYVIHERGRPVSKRFFLEGKKQVCSIRTPARVPVTASSPDRVEQIFTVTFPVVGIQLTPAIIPSVCVEDEQTAPIPVKIRQGPVLIAYRCETRAREIVKQVDRRGGAVLDVQHTDLIGS